MANYNVATLIDEVILKSKDPSFSRALVLEFLQDVQDEVLGRSILSFKKKTLLEILGAGDYSFQYDCKHDGILQVVLTDETSPNSLLVTEPKYIPANKFFEIYPSPDDDTNSGSPWFYTDYEGQLVFPQKLDKDYKLTMRYLEASSQLEDSTTCYPDIPRRFKKIYTEGGLAGVERYRENFDIAGVHDRKVEDIAEDMTGRTSMRVIRAGKATTSRVVHGKV